MTSRSARALSQPSGQLVGVTGVEGANATEIVADTELPTAKALADFDQQFDCGEDAVGQGPPQVRRAIVPVDSIIVGETFGRELEDAYVCILAAVVERYQLRDPITVTPNRRLLAGHRWLAAVKKLGWTAVEVIILEVAP
jgi:hypothetical protein